MAKPYALGGMIGLIALAAAQAQAQTDLNAGMSAPQLFAANCAACHRSAQGLSRGRDPASLAYFLRDHYTTRPAIAAALAGYLASQRGPARPVAVPGAPGAPGAPGGEQTAAPAARPKPIERLANATVERLKSFAADANPAKPSVPDTPERGVARLLSYSASGVAVESLRDSATGKPARSAPRVPPEQGLAPASSALPQTAEEPPKKSVEEPSQKEAQAPASAAAPAARASGPAPIFRGPPPGNARPTSQSNEDRP